MRSASDFGVAQAYLKKRIQEYLILMYTVQSGSLIGQRYKLYFVKSVFR